MSGAGLQVIRNHGGDRWCCPGSDRRSGQLWRSQRRAPFLARPDVGFDNRRGPFETPAVSPSLPPTEQAEARRSNLDRFLEATTPSFPVQFPPEVYDGGGGVDDDRNAEAYFDLGDLWESFREWSAYGAGVPVVLNEKEQVVQYYVPYLSGIQIYGGLSPSDQSRCTLSAANEKWHDIFSSEDHANFLRMDNLSLNDRSKNCSECSSCSDDSSVGIQQGHLFFEYFEHDQPHCREPLADKIANLTGCYPELMTLRSCDISSSSWMSVAWYPIYRIPTGSTLRDLDACFLTFHFLSMPMGASNGVITHPRGNDYPPKVLLPSFGLSWYKYKGSFWARRGAGEQQSANLLLEAAAKWLRILEVNHPDYQFFSSNCGHRR